MPTQLKISIGQHSDPGRKDVNQDFHGALIPLEPQLNSKGIVVALADGISSSAVSRAASETAVKSFLDDYYCTSDAWSVKKSGQRVLLAANSWLHAQNQQSPFRYEKDRGYICTLSAIVFKSTTAHLFHVGDSRMYRLHGRILEQLTHDHRVVLAEGKSYLGRALGMDAQIEIDYQALSVDVGDIFVLATDGVYEFVSAVFIHDAIVTHSTDLNAVARMIVAEALRCGSSDNLTVQVARVDELPQQNMAEAYRRLAELPFLPMLEARMRFDGYEIVRELHASSRSHVYLAIDEETKTRVAIKVPSIDLREEPAYLERFLMEEWIARRVESPHVLKSHESTRSKKYLYVVTEYIEGQTLNQWMIDNPRPKLEAVRALIEQIAKGLRAFHRLEMLHQDLRPENVLIDATGTAKIIDFGSTRVAGIMEIASPIERQTLLGTAQYTAPEYFVGAEGTSRSDIFSLGVITYQMLSGALPYGAEVARKKTRAEQRTLRYRTLLGVNRDIPAWIDATLEKAVHPDPAKRYEEVSEFLYDLRHPNRNFENDSRAPLIERDPIAFWKTVSLILIIIIILLLIVIARR